jgi:hypothetical protein
MLHSEKIRLKRADRRTLRGRRLQYNAQRQRWHQLSAHFCTEWIKSQRCEKEITALDRARRAIVEH